MGSYDSPGFIDRTPAGPVVQNTGAAGSVAVNVPTATTSYDTGGTTASSALVTPSGGSLVNADRVPVGPNDTLVGLQADQYQGADPNILSGGIPGSAFGTTGAGRGRVRGPGNPNAAGGAA